jgi:hypothetical protein
MNYTYPDGRLGMVLKRLLGACKFQTLASPLITADQQRKTIDLLPVF